MNAAHSAAIRRRCWRSRARTAAATAACAAQAEAWYRKAVALEPQQAVAARIELAHALNGACGGEPRPHESARLWVELAQRKPDDAEFLQRLERIVEPGVPLPVDPAEARQMLFTRAAAALLLDERGTAWAAARSLGALGIDAGADEFERRALREIEQLRLDGEQPPPPRYTVVANDPDPEVVTDAVTRARIRATGLPWKVRHERTGLAFVLIPAGEFLMGSPADEQGREADETQHQRSIGGAFYLSQTEVTVEAWASVMPALPRAIGRGPQHAANAVTWLAATEFCKRAGRGIRLPSEAEWEYACRAGSSTPYWFGTDGGRLAEFEWCATNSGGALKPVATRRPNGLGLFDMQGNVAEWCVDSKFDYPGSGDAAPASRAGPWRALRGGTWSGTAGRSADRSWAQQDATSLSSGFRIVMMP